MVNGRGSGQQERDRPRQSGETGGQQGERDSQEAEQDQGGGQSGSNGGQGGGGGGLGKEPTTAEWIIGVICGLIVLSMVGYLFYHALSRPTLPPVITIRVERVVPVPEGYLVEFAAANEGTKTAANLMVEGSLLRDTVVVETSTATIAFVPAGTEREGGLFFTRDPRRYRLEVRPAGYDLP